MEPRVLTCEQCGSPYLEGVTICYVCGAPLGEDERPTHPVRVPVHLRARVTQVLPAVRAAPPTAPPAPGGALGKPANLVPPANPGAPASFWRFALGPPSRARAVQLALLALSLVAFLAGLVVLSYRLIPPAFPAQAVYRDPAHHFHFAQPALWQATPTLDGVRLTDSTGTSTVLITIGQPVAGVNVAPYADSLDESLGIGPAAPVDVNGVTWEASVGQVTDAGGATHLVAAYLTVQQGLLYIVEFSSPAHTFDATNTLVFQPLLRSFAFD
jgi:hypothetical protein